MDEYTCKCGAESEGYHSCPYASDIVDDDSEDHCNCCERCTDECMMEI